MHDETRPSEKAEGGILTNDLNGLWRADGLTADESAIIQSLAAVRCGRLARNERRMAYYDDEVECKNLGLAVPPQIARDVDTSVGWCAKAVDALATRTVFDGFTCMDAPTAEKVAEIVKTSDMPMSYKMAVPSELVYGCGFWTVSPDEDFGVAINYHDAVTASALWDYRRKRVKAGLVVEDFRQKGKTTPDLVEPCFVVVHTSDSVIELERGERSDWHAVRKPHRVGRPLIEPMCYKPTNKKPFGASRITKACMGITDDMMREIVRTSLHSELYSSGMKAILGVTDEQYDAIMGDRYRAAMTSLFVATRDREGNVPDIEQFAQQSMEPHIAAMDKLAARMASETNLPSAAFGVDAKVYTSNDSLKASTADLVLEAENLNKTNGRAMRNVALLALAILGNKPVKELAPEELNISVHWRDPAMPSVASVSDAVIKQVSAVPAFGGTSVFWEKLGYSEEERERIKAETEANGEMAIAASVFGGGSGKGGTEW